MSVQRLCVKQAVTLADYETVSALFTNRDYLQYGTMSRHTSRAAILQSMLDNRETGAQKYFYASTEGKPFAAVGIAAIDWLNRNAEVHVATDLSDISSQNLAAVLREILRIAFENMKLLRLYGFTPNCNKGLIALAILLGGKIEGRFEHGLFADGHWHPTCALGVLKSEAIYRRRRENNCDSSKH